MTKLTNAIRRETARTFTQGRPIIVILEPGDMIAFRPKGCRKVWRTTLSACLWLAVKAEAKELAKQKALVRKQRKEGRE